MEEEAKRKLKKFIKPNMKELIFGIIFIIIGAVFFAIEFQNDIQFGVIVLMLAVALGGIFVGWAAIKKSNFNKKLGEIERSGTLPEILNDFETGRKMFKDSLILGKTFIIGKHSGTVLNYNEVDSLYQLVKVSGGKGNRIIQVKTADKKKINLCTIPIKGSNANEDLGRALGYITAKNRNIQL